MVVIPRTKLPATAKFKRPPELLYATNERPPAATLAVLTLQHTITALTFIAYVLAAARLGGLDTAATQTLVTAAILTMAIATLLQAWGGGLGAGLQLVHIPSPYMLLIYGALLGQYGVGGLLLAGLVSGITAIVTSFALPYLRTLLPPVVAGVIACMGGIGLIQPALQQISGLTVGGVVQPADLLVGATTLVIIIGLSIWGGERTKLFALLAGLIAGTLVAAFFGQVHGIGALAQTPTFGLPHPPTPSFDIGAGMLLAIAALSLMSQLDDFGGIVIMHKMNDADWRRPDMKMISGGFRATGIGDIIGSFLGGFPSNASSANIGLTFISRTTSRHIGLLAAGALFLVAFLPQVSRALSLIPAPVIGAVEIYAAAYLIVSGIELIATRAMDARGTFIIGLSFVLGTGVIFVPQLAHLAPESMLLLASNGIVIAAIVAIGLNLLFRLGTSQQTRQDFAADMSASDLSQAVVEFVEINGGHWQARREVVQRAAQAALEATEAIQGTHGRILRGIRGRFDEFNLDIELLHTGAPLSLERKPTAQPAAADLLDIDDAAFDAALDEALMNVSQVMINRLADRLQSGQRGELPFLKLHFDH